LLNGIKVLDLSWVLGGPFGGQILAQLGAEVIKVESPGGDMAREIPPYFYKDESSFFLSVNRGKKSVVIDLKNKEGLKVFYDLVKEADAVIYGFAPDVPKRLGVDFETLNEINPKIIVAQLIGFHDEPPYSAAPAFDLIVQAMGGFMSITGEEGGSPVRAGYQIADLAGGLYLAISALGALLSAALKGKGRLVQISLLDCQLALLTWQAQNYFISGNVPKAQGSRHPMIAPSEAFECADGKLLVISPTGDAFWEKFCMALDRPDLAKDERFANSASRIENVDELSEVLSDVFKQRDRDEWAADLFEKRIPAAPVFDVSEALAQPLALLRSMVEMVPSPEGEHEELAFLGNPFKHKETKVLDFPPSLGAHTDEVLTRICGYDQKLLTHLRSVKAIF